jgi:hypothetical protein
MVSTRILAAVNAYTFFISLPLLVLPLLLH